MIHYKSKGHSLPSEYEIEISGSPDVGVFRCLTHSYIEPDKKDDVNYHQFIGRRLVTSFQKKFPNYIYYLHLSPPAVSVLSEDETKCSIAFKVFALVANGPNDISDTPFISYWKIE
jgi:hypothetical protein